MNGTQATQIRSLLLEAADAIDRANAIVSALDSDDRALLAIPLDEISSALHFELLQKLYLRYPGLAEEGAGLGRHHGMSCDAKTTVTDCAISIYCWATFAGNGVFVAT